jgi:hypothetical protein
MKRHLLLSAPLAPTTFAGIGIISSTTNRLLSGVPQFSL